MWQFVQNVWILWCYLLCASIFFYLYPLVVSTGMDSFLPLQMCSNNLICTAMATIGTIVAGLEEKEEKWLCKNLPERGQ